MGLYSDYAAAGAETVATQAGDPSFGTAFGGVISGAVVSGVQSFYNTGVAVGNALGADWEEANTYETLRDLDENWASYYQQNKQAIDVAGFVGTSLVPGMAAIKALNAFRAGNTVGAVGRGLNFTRTKSAEHLAKALDEMAVEGGSVFSRVNSNLLKSMAWETADQVLQAGVFELAVAATMKQSPVLADESLWDITKGVMWGAALGGGIGGAVEGLILRSATKQAAKRVSLAENEYKVYRGLTSMDIAEGDKAFELVKEIVNLPKVADSATAAIDFAAQFPKLVGSTKGTIRDFTTYFTNTIKGAEKAAIDDFKISLRKLVGESTLAGSGDTQAADAIVNWLGKRLEAARAGTSSIDATEDLGSLLHQLKKVTPATDEPLYQADELMYFKKSLSPDERAKFETLQDWKEGITRNVPFGDNAYSSPYVFLGKDTDWAGLQLAKVNTKELPTLAAAWKEGYHIAQQADGTLRVNPASKLFRRVDDPVYTTRRFVNTRTGAFTEDTVLTAADRAAYGKQMKVSEWGVEIPRPNGETIRYAMKETAVRDGSLTYDTARHAWASQLSTRELAKMTSVDATDWGLMQALKEAKLSDDVLENIDVHLPDGSTITAGEFFYDANYLQLLKIQELEKAFGGGVHDIRELAARFAVDESFIERIVASGFRQELSEKYLQGSIVDLKRFTTRENVVAHYETPHQFTNIESLQGKSWKEKRDAILEDVAKNGGTFVTGELAYTYRVSGAKQALVNASTAVLGAEAAGRFISLDAKAARTADVLGTGSTFLASSNASYGEVLKAAQQDIGKHTHQLVLAAKEAVTSAMNTVAQKILINRKAAAEVGIVRNILRADNNVFYPALDGSQKLIRRELVLLEEKIAAATAEGKTVLAEKLTKELDTARKGMVDSGEKVEIIVKEADAWEFLQTHRTLNETRLNKERTLVNARGMTSNKDPRAMYAPPVDTNYFQHFAFVRNKDGKAFGTSEVSMIFGRDAQELQRRISMVDQSKFDVITKEAGERYHKAKGDYDFDQTINERNIDSELRKSGALSDFFPEVRAENIVEDFLRFHTNQESKVVRNAVEGLYAQQIEELRYMGRNFMDDATSKFSGTLRAAKSEIWDPYTDGIKTMLDISKRSEYRFFHQANEFVDALGVRAYQVWADVTGKAQKGLIPWEEAEQIAKDHGIGGLYSKELDYFTSNVPRDRNLIKSTLARANTLLSRVVLQFDFAQALMNIVSTPVLLGTELASIRKLVGQNSELTGMLNELTTVKVPGTGGTKAVPSTMKLLHGAIKNYFGPNKLELIKRYTENGDIKGVSMLHHEAIESLSMNPNFKMFSDGVEKVSEKLTKWTANEFAEEFTRFVSADVMRQLTEPLVQAGKMDLKTQNAYTSIFTNRVQGNYITSQRPIVFQGVLGGAVSLFQTYQFNLLQQLLRHVGDKNGRAVATMYGLQSGLFGLNGLPMFDAVNQHLIGTAAGNEGHYDVNRFATGLRGKEYGDWLMYGTVSAFPAWSEKAPALYTRGDINPRHVSILPITPGDIPAVDATIRFVSNLADTGKNIAGGAPIGESLLQGLEHNGLNRPLAGLAQVFMGHSTTSKGSLISANSDFSLIASASRIAGAKPMDEAVALNYLFRQNAYKAADADRINALGERVKKSLIGGKDPSLEDIETWMRDYAASGGRIEAFNSSLIRWMRDANTSTVNSVMKKVNSLYGQALSEVMGGEALEDYSSLPVTPPQE